MKHIVSRLIAPCQYHKAFISPPCVIRHGDHITSSDRQLFTYPSRSAIGPYPALGLALDCQNLKNLRNNFCHLFRVRTSPSLSIASLYMQKVYDRYCRQYLYHICCCDILTLRKIKIDRCIFYNTMIFDRMHIILVERIFA